jgi:ABC-type transport system substrate-binding protein
VALDQVTFKTLFSFPYDPAGGKKTINFYRQGGVTVVDRLEPVDLAYLKDIPRSQVVGAVAKGILALWFNQRIAAPSAQLNGGAPIFTDARVRMAFVEAFDRCGALRAVLGLRDCHDRNYVTDEPAVPTSPSYDPTVTLPAFNPTDAARLLDSVGFPVVKGIRRLRDGTTPLTLTLTTAHRTEAYHDFVSRLRQDYARYLHVTVNEALPVGDSFDDASTTGAFDIGLLQMRNGSDPEELVGYGYDSASIPSTLNPKGSNFFGVIDPWMVAQGQAAAETLNVAQRADITKAMARHLAEQLYLLPVLLLADITLVAPTLCNYKQAPPRGPGPAKAGYLWNMADWYLASGPACP